MQTFEDLFTEKLQDLYSAETQILKAVPSMIDATESGELRSVLKDHLKETSEHIKRLEKIGKDLEIDLTGKECKGMKGLLAEGAEVIKESQKSAVRDAALIAASQSVEHYEIAGYGTAMAYAKLLGQKDALDLLEKTLEEEKHSDELLSQLAENRINHEAKEQELPEETFQGAVL